MSHCNLKKELWATVLQATAHHSTEFRPHGMRAHGNGCRRMTKKGGLHLQRSRARSRYKHHFRRYCLVPVRLRFGQALPRPSPNLYICHLIIAQTAGGGPDRSPCRALAAESHGGGGWREPWQCRLESVLTDGLQSIGCFGNCSRPFEL